MEGVWALVPAGMPHLCQVHCDWQMGTMEGGPSQLEIQTSEFVNLDEDTGLESFLRCV